MGLLLDTCVLLWWPSDPGLLKAPGRARLEDRRNTVFVSAASAWEIAIKRGKPGFDAPEDLDAVLAIEGFLPLPITFAHARAVAAEATVPSWQHRSSAMNPDPPHPRR